MSHAYCLLALIALSLSACAHGPRSSGADGAHKVADLFHHRVRWKDFGGAALLVVPEKREAFEQARQLLKDERDLTVADYQLDEIQVSPDQLSARLVSRVSWYRLPSVSAHEDTVVTELVWHEGAWLIARQTGGPFEEELSAPWVPPAQDAGTP